MGTVAMLIAVFSLLGVIEANGLFEDIGSSPGSRRSLASSSLLRLHRCRW